MKTFQRIWIKGVVSLILTFPLHAQTTMSLKGLNLNYQSQNGTFQFQELKLKNAVHQSLIRAQDAQFSYNPDTSSLELQHEMVESTILLPKKELLDATTQFQVENLNIDLNDSQLLSIDWDELALHIGTGLQSLSGAKILCHKIESKLELQVLAQCFESMMLSMREIQLPASSSSTYYSFFPESVSGKKNFLTLKKISDVSFKSLKNQFDLSVHTKLLINFNLLIKGVINLQELADQKYRVDMTLKSAKISFINVKKLVLLAISKANIANLYVNGDTVSILL